MPSGNLLDRRGNWTGFSSQINTSLAEQERELDTTDKQNAGVNEYDRSMTKIGNQWVYEEFAYDDNGNLIAIDMVGDVNCDGVTDFNDNNVFILLLTDPQQYALDYPDCSGALGDVNNNGSVGFDDINGFVDLLTNLGDGEARRFDYDDENRLIAVKEYDGALITEYVYDALGRRIEVTDHVSTADACGDSTSPVRTRQVYSGLATIQEYVWCATAGEWTAAREFLYGASFLEPVALVDWTELGDEAAGTEEVLHYVHDRLGSVVALTDAGQPDAQPTPIPPKAVERYEYDPYGQTYVEVWDETLNGGLGGWATASESKYGNQLMWTAQRYDATTGLYHFPARAYSPRLGRWLQRDPLGYVDGVSLYEYCQSTPMVFIDPLGYQSSAGGYARLIGQMTQAARKAINLLRKAAEKLKNAKDRLSKAGKKLNEAKTCGNKDDIRRAQQEYDKAQKAAQRAQQNYNKHYNRTQEEIRKAKKDLNQQFRNGNKDANGALKGMENDVEQIHKGARGTANKGTPQQAPKRGVRERNRGIDEEHSRVPKGTGGGQGKGTGTKGQGSRGQGTGAGGQNQLRTSYWNWMLETDGIMAPRYGPY